MQLATCWGRASDNTEDDTMTAWSYSSLTAFETCPKRYFHTRVAKDIVEPEGDALLWGSAVHKALENRVKDGTPLPTGTTQWEPLCAKLLASPGEIFTERQLCLDYRFQPTAWYGDDAWVRGVVDVGVLRDDEIVALDYKTGRPKPDTDQLQLFAALLFASHPEVDTIKTGYVWLKTNGMTVETYQREQLPLIWGGFLGRVKRLEGSFKDDHWPEKPSGLCRAWCPCTGCKFNGRYGAHS